VACESVEVVGQDWGVARVLLEKALEESDCFSVPTLEQHDDASVALESQTYGVAAHLKAFDKEGHRSKDLIPVQSAYELIKIVLRLVLLGFH